MGQLRPLFVYFRSFQTQILQKKLYASAGFELQSSEPLYAIQKCIFTNFTMSN